MTEAQAKKELAEEEEERLASGGVSLHAMSAGSFVAMGLDLEDAQCVVSRMCSCTILTHFEYKVSNSTASKGCYCPGHGKEGGWFDRATKPTSNPHTRLGEAPIHLHPWPSPVSEQHPRDRSLGSTQARSPRKGNNLVAFVPSNGCPPWHLFWETP